MPQLTSRACSLRNLRSARQTGPDAVRLFLSPDLEEYARSNGKLAKSVPDALSMINALLPSGSEALTPEQVYIRYAEAANSNFISDRWMFLDESTLRNIALNAAEGVAFMNSHRTGGMSAPAELPYGKTFCGRYEEDGDRKRCIVGFYMLRGVNPNGSNGPSTDEMFAQIEGGTLNDVSVGLYGGKRPCDVCGKDIREWDEQTGWYACPHVPGATDGMSKDQINNQRKRGVPDGCASYSLTDARMGELSGVYDGAVPGAGFRYAPLFNQPIPAEGFRKMATFDREGRLSGYCSGYEFLTRIEEQPADGLTFETQLSRALTAVDECLERGLQLKQMREDQGRGRLLSPDRRVQLEQIHSRLTGLLQATTPAEDRVSALRHRSLRLQAAALTLPGE